MSLKELKAKEQKRLELDELPEEIDVKIIKWVEEKDKRGDLCLFVNMNSAKGDFTQKYTPYHYSELVKAFEKLDMDGWEEAVNKGIVLHMKRKTFAMGNARYIPQSIIA